ncbi:unnamed protein product [Protopolystoma xenopodis]|uniref:Uncharacterized protein n=1 Tax=Protopolystoma xenopodis TaxID=117903 RepID=A0A3S5B4Q1_9PLAT|nr:unnamed protein product [Protopolystoma xenopodis]
MLSPPQACSPFLLTLLGIGNGMAYLCCLLAISTHFEEKRPIAMGITVCGSGIERSGARPRLNESTRAIGTEAIVTGSSPVPTRFRLKHRYPKNHTLIQSLYCPPTNHNIHSLIPKQFDCTKPTRRLPLHTEKYVFGRNSWGEIDLE